MLSLKFTSAKLETCTHKRYFLTIKLIRTFILYSLLSHKVLSTVTYYLLFHQIYPSPDAAEQLVFHLNYHTKDGITLTCNTQGLPVTSSTWDNNCASIVDHNAIEQMAMLQDTQSSSYVTELIVQNSNLSVLKDCTLKCDVYTNWVVADQSSFGRQRKWKSTQIQVSTHNIIVWKGLHYII